MDILTNFLSQIVFTVGVVVLFGFLIGLCRRAFCKIVGRMGTVILLITGIIGTPIHELSHAFMCLVFGHRIEEIKLYDPDTDSGTLGYVNHSYNERNLYHQIGNFFIGIAPVLGGSGVLLLLMLFMTPDIHTSVIGEFGLSAGFSISGFFEAWWNIIKYVFDFDNMSSGLWWLFIILAISISSHMELSGADIIGSAKGFSFLAAVLLIVDVILYFISIDALETVTSAMTSFSLALSTFLALSLIFLLAMLLVALIIKGIGALIFH